MHYFEDFTVGDRWDLGSETYEREDIMAFAEQYDPMPFHIDEGRARETRYGGLIASGWQVVMHAMHAVATEVLADSACEAGRGADDFRMYTPVRPGDTLSFTAEVTDTMAENRPGYGLVDVKLTATNQDGQTVCSLVILPMIRRRPTE